MTDQPSPDKTAAMTRAFDTASGPLTFVKSIGNDDAYVREIPAGNVLVVIPGMWTSMPGQLLTALRARRRANVTGRCPACDGVFDSARGGLLHESDCSASDALIAPALEAWSRQVGRYARGRRIVEDPA